MNRPPASKVPRSLRLAPWGQISVLERQMGETALLVETIHVAAGQAELALAVADNRTRLRHPAMVPTVTVVAVADAGRGPSLRIELEAPRGTALIDMLERTGKLSEATIIGMMRDVLVAVVEAHSKSIVVGNLGPDHLVLCPPGHDDLPPLRVVHAGLGPVIEAARGTPLPMEGSGFAQLHTIAEVVAPEVFAGTQMGSSSDAYALCATIARCALGRYVHGSAQAAVVRDNANHGIQALDAQELLDALPRLGALIAKGLASTAWARAGVLAELVAACNQHVQNWPTVTLRERECIAPWLRGSPLVPLAAYTSTAPWSDRWQAMASVGTPLRFDAVRSASQMQAAATIAELPQANQAKLRAAMEQLGAEKNRTQQRSDQRDKRGSARLVAFVVLILLVAVIVAVAARRTAELDDTILPEFHRPVGPKKAPPPRPQSIIIDPNPGQ
ncbi:MAG: hypothetical protein EXR77_10065 [Myxococcales bacterium]|nr:hypothetical protein [Myxococcales bacterium]